MSPILAPNFYELYGAKQTAKGTPASFATTIGTHRFNQVGGQFSWARADGSESYSDMSKYASQSDWVDSVVGSGDPIIEATPEEIAWAYWALHGGETVTAITGPPALSKHSYVPSLGRPHWVSFFQRLGNTAPFTRRLHSDCMVSRIQLEGSTANKALRATLGVQSLSPGINQANPITANKLMPSVPPYLYTDGAGTFTLDTVVYPGQTQFTFVVDEAWTPVFGDDVVPFDMVQGTPTCTISVTLLLDSAALALFNKQVYGSTAPSDGATPQKRIPALGSYSFVLTQAANGIKMNLTIPSIKWTPPAFPGPNPSGGPTEIVMSGSLRGSTGYTIDVYTDPAVVAFVS